MKKLIAVAALIAIPTTFALAQTPSQTSPLAPRRSGSALGGAMSGTTGPAAAPSGGVTVQPNARTTANKPDDSGDRAIQAEDNLIDTKIKNICVKC